MCLNISVVIQLLLILKTFSALKIDNELRVVKSDCYERMAIGQRLSPKDIYRKVDVNTVKDCQNACTKDQKLCRALSFGIGVKGNGTCELSSESIRETADLRPIGTIEDTDYDLYIKKLDCSLVIDENEGFGGYPQKPQQAPAQIDYGVESVRPPPSEPSISYGPNSQHSSYGSNSPSHPIKPTSEHYESQRPNQHYSNAPSPDEYRPHFPDRPPHYESNGPYHYPKPQDSQYNTQGHPNNLPQEPDIYRPRPQYRPPNYYEPHRPDDNTEEHVQTLVSVATGPNKLFLHPVHQILIGEGPYGSQIPNDNPKFLNPYELESSRPPYNYNRSPSYVDRYDSPYHYGPNYDYERFRPQNYRPRPPRPPPPEYYRRPRPTHDYLFQNGAETKINETLSVGNSNDGVTKKPPAAENSIVDKSGKPIITQSIGSHGEKITSIITEIKEACFRRVLAGKRVSRGFVKRSIICERIEDCQRECADEKNFVCEGFNYRLDPTGRGKGECELLDLPLSQIDIGRDLYPEPDYDYYERDRNAATVNCHKGSDRDYYSGGASGGGGNRRGYYDYHDRWYEERRPSYDRWQDRRPPSYYEDDYRRRPEEDRRRPSADRRHDYPWRDDDYRGGGNRRGDFAYHSHHSQQNYKHSHHYNHQDDHYLPPSPPNYHHYPPPPSHSIPPPYDYKSYEPFLPPRRYTITKYYLNKDKDDSWGNDRYGSSYGYNKSYRPDNFDGRNYYLPPKIGPPKDWGQYGGSYGNVHQNSLHHDSHFDYWGFKKYESDRFDESYGLLPPKHGPSYVPDRPPNGGSYLPERPRVPARPPPGENYLPAPPPPQHGNYLPGLPPPQHGNYLPGPPPPQHGNYLPRPPPPQHGNYIPTPHRPSNTGSYLPTHPHEISNALLPAEPRFPPYNFIKDECSLRTATGFRLHKGIVKKFYAVPNIYECELLCFKEKDFPCASYAFRYTISLTTPTDNCYLSNRNYKELDFYTDLQPDRDFDIYTMNNMNHCEQPIVIGKDNSVRSAQRLEHKVVRDSLTVKSIVECQIECLKSTRFTCRAFSFRYGSPVIGGVIDNCQLTDWPYYELDSKIHFVPEQGFEIYERGSYGHGCEPDHFGIRGRPFNNPANHDQLCYIGFGSPARLLPQATRKAIKVTTELDCKIECSKLRGNTLFQCMSFSFRTEGDFGPNCLLSDILQRDLLSSVDYVQDPNSWLFAWDNYNPECVALADGSSHNFIDKDGGLQNRYDDHPHHDLGSALDTWRVYSVRGWPCRRGSLCQENREAGFWFCELEGGDPNSWDYCCHPDHQCGYSEGFPYQWCYVGSTRSQWRKCSDRYYPYFHNYVDRFDPEPANYIYDKPSRPIRDPWTPPYRPGIHPDRPPAPPTQPPPQPSLDEYEAEFASQFLDPPKPGGFGQPRRWPVSYLHKEKPPNNTEIESRSMKTSRKDSNPKFAAIQSLIDVIQSNDLKNVQYQITNESNAKDDILFVKIPLPTNFTQESSKSEKIVKPLNTTTVSDPIDFKEDVGKDINNTKRSQKALPAPVIRRGYITRTNVTNYGRRNLE